MSDIWSIGCTIIELLTGHPPFYDVPHLRALYIVIQSEVDIPQNISKELYDCLAACLRKNPLDRPTAEQLLSDPWLADFASDRGPSLAADLVCRLWECPAEKACGQLPARVSAKSGGSEDVPRPLPAATPCSWHAASASEHPLPTSCLQRLFLHTRSRSRSTVDPQAPPSPPSPSREPSTSHTITGNTPPAPPPLLPPPLLPVSPSRHLRPFSWCTIEGGAVPFEEKTKDKGKEKKKKGKKTEKEKQDHKTEECNNKADM
eukprot:TRINITY_DN6935_c0_g6_i2.p1 TRINITY_DN6935_c0_g6~~TRINITY_DN6935_c0_g6_i2.p1  ORF type:complete len:260 (+),score=57.55 TRINITY_DN6935_c0_g6_i2:763-1542(+)